MPRSTTFRTLNSIRSRSIRNSTRSSNCWCAIGSIRRAALSPWRLRSAAISTPSLAAIPTASRAFSTTSTATSSPPDQIAAGATPVTIETDAVYRERVWLSPSILSLNGPGQGTYESYKFWALSAPQFAGQPLLRDASCFTKAGTGNVYIPIMSDVFAPVSTLDPVSKNVYTTVFNGNPMPSKEQVSAVYQYITAPDMARKGLDRRRQRVVAQGDQHHASTPKSGCSLASISQSTMLATMQSVNRLVAAIRWLGADLTMMSLTAHWRSRRRLRRRDHLADCRLKVDSGGCINVLSSTLTYMGVAE